ncbi:MAG: aldehyde dehydrogenase family protein [Bacteriovoracaceae bacterium]|nr:aldehyde dehydrogenase family protein [Bacteriovoracaceae bacterium]
MFSTNNGVEVEINGIDYQVLLANQLSQQDLEFVKKFVVQAGGDATLIQSLEKLQSNFFKNDGIFVVLFTKNPKRVAATLGLRANQGRNQYILTSNSKDETLLKTLEDWSTQWAGQRPGNYGPVISIVDPKGGKIYETSPSPYKVLKSIPENKMTEKLAQYFENLKSSLLKVEGQIRAELAKIETSPGINYEWTQVIDTLDQVNWMEGGSILRLLNSQKSIEHGAVYAATNIPLYTLFLNGFIPLSYTDQIWFRTPEATREIYVNLYNLIAAEMKKLGWNVDNLRILFSPENTVYQNFLNEDVLGKIKNAPRAPVDYVVFTGSPETSKTIVNSISKHFSNHKELEKPLHFFSFGVGSNPLIMSEDVDINLAVKIMTESLGINSGQDCIFPNFYLAPKSHRSALLEKVRSEVGKFHFSKDGNSSDELLTYTPLNMSKNLNKPIDFLNEHAANIIFQIGAPDSERRIIHPTVLGFNLTDVLNNDIHFPELYSPILPIIFYDDYAQIKRLLGREDLRRIAMYASVIGKPYATSPTTNLIYLLMSYGYGVVPGESIFVGESGSIPFGGHSEDASQYTIIRPNKPAETHNRPLLISKDLANGLLPKNSASPSLTSLSDLRKIQKLYSNKLLENMKRDPSSPRLINDWNNFNTPRTNYPLASGEPLIKPGTTFKLIFDGGMVPKEHLEEEALPDLERFLGFPGQTFFYDRSGTQVNNFFNSTLLHVSSKSIGGKMFNDVGPGARDLLSGNGYWLALLKNKGHELAFADKYTPDVYLESYFLDALKDYKKENFKKIEKIKNDLVSKLERNDYHWWSLHKTETIGTIVSLINEIFYQTRLLFPQGTYFKGFGEYATADLGNVVATSLSNPKIMALEFYRRVLSFLNSKGQIHQQNWDTALNQVGAEAYTKFISHLLFEPSAIFFQPEQTILKTITGTPFEIRIDIIYGEIVSIRDRFGFNYLPKDMEEASQFLQRNFLDKLPPEFKMLSAGVDIAKIQGKNRPQWKVIEFNFGPNSGTLHPELFPLIANQLFSNILKQDTPIIKELNSMAKAAIASNDLSAIVLMVKAKKQGNPLWIKWKEEEISKIEYLEWFRNYFLNKNQRQLASKLLEQNYDDPSIDFTLKKLKTGAGL